MRKFTIIQDLETTPGEYESLSPEVESHFYEYMEDIERHAVESELHAQMSASKIFLSK